MKPPKPKICLVPDCKNVVYLRGLCHGCYYNARLLVARKQVTWHQLEKSGRCKPRKTRDHRPVTDWFLDGIKVVPVTTCHCGQPLHYTDPRVEAYMHRTVAEHGEYITVACEGAVYHVPRHYIALHGLVATDLPKLGFKRKEL